MGIAMSIADSQLEDPWKVSWHWIMHSLLVHAAAALLWAGPWLSCIKEKTRNIWLLSLGCIEVVVAVLLILLTVTQLPRTLQNPIQKTLFIDMIIMLGMGIWAAVVGIQSLGSSAPATNDFELLDVALGYP